MQIINPTFYPKSQFVAERLSSKERKVDITTVILMETTTESDKKPSFLLSPVSCKVQCTLFWKYLDLYGLGLNTNSIPTLSRPIYRTPTVIAITNYEFINLCYHLQGIKRNNDRPHVVISAWVCFDFLSWQLPIIHM